MDSQNKLNSPINYCLYARKSSESDERQAMSIDSKIKEMLALAQRDNLVVTEVREESHSAKASLRKTSTQPDVDEPHLFFNNS